MSSPLPFDDAIEPFRVEGPVSIRALLSEIVIARAAIELFVPKPDGQYMTPIEARIASIDDEGIDFDYDAGPMADAALESSSEIVLVSLSGSVRFQARLGDLQVGAQTQDARHGRLSVSLPAEAWRIQRRQAFRVAPPVTDEAVVHLRLLSEDVPRECTVPILDLSASGLSLALPPEIGIPAAGTTWAHSRVEAHGVDPIPCTLQVIRVFDETEPDGGRRVSCEFVAMPSEPARRVQLYVMSIERRLSRMASAARAHE